MISKIDLFNRYKEEKAMVIGSEAERTGLEDFPTFNEWQAEYVEQWNDTHKTVDTKQADEMFDNLVEEAEEELEGVNFEASDCDDEDDIPESPPVAPPVKVKPKQVAKPVVKKAKPRSKPVYASRKASKTAKAQKIFDRFYGSKTRKEIIEKFVAQVDMTSAGASTYYQKFKKAKE